MKYVPDAQNPIYKFAQDINDISTPLKKHLGINEFTYEKIYNDNTKIKLTNQPEWMSFFYSQGYHLLGDSVIKSLDKKILFTTDLNSINRNNEIFTACRNKFHIGNGIILIEFFDHYKEIYWFTCDRDHQIFAHYYNNIDLLKIFINYFKEKASHLITISEQKKILIPSNNLQDPFNTSDQLTMNEAAFLKSLDNKKYSFSTNKLNISLTKQELKCALGIIKGKSANEIASDVFRSRRTIESTIMRIKNKLGQQSKTGLIDTFWQLGINIYLDKDL